jgi:hypothetical protein
VLARVSSPPPATPDKKLEEELVKLASKQQVLLLKSVEKDQSLVSDQV